MECALGFFSWRSGAASVLSASSGAPERRSRASAARQWGRLKPLDVDVGGVGFCICGRRAGDVCGGCAVRDLLGRLHYARLEAVLRGDGRVIIAALESRSALHSLSGAINFLCMDSCVVLMVHMIPRSLGFGGRVGGFGRFCKMWGNVIISKISNTVLSKINVNPKSSLNTRNL